MGNRREFDIAFVGLKPGIHEFQYEVDQKFFSEFDIEDLSDFKAKVTVTLEKTVSHMVLKFEIDGSVLSTCDRCQNPLRLPLWDEFSLIIKSVENPEEMNSNEEDPDIFYISRTESHLHLANWIYEFVMLSVPNQRMCSEEEMGGPQCNKEILDMLKKMKSNTVENNNPLKKGLENFIKKQQ